MSMAAAPEDVADLPPSAKLVHKVLEYEGDLTHGEIVEETQLPSRTARYALDQLLDADLVEKRTDLTDARRYRYSLSDA